MSSCVICYNISNSLWQIVIRRKFCLEPDGYHLPSSQVLERHEWAVFT